MLPLLLFQLHLQIIWLLAVAFPQWSDFQSVELTKIMLFGLIIDSLVIPWPFVFRNYVKAHGDHWKRQPKQKT